MLYDTGYVLNTPGSDIPETRGPTFSPQGGASQPLRAPSCGQKTGAPAVTGRTEVL